MQWRQLGGGGRGALFPPKNWKLAICPPPPKKKWKNGGKIIKRRKIKQKIRTFYSKWAVAEIRWEKWLGGGQKIFALPRISWNDATAVMVLWDLEKFVPAYCNDASGFKKIAYYRYCLFLIFLLHINYLLRIASVEEVNGINWLFVI